MSSELSVIDASKFDVNKVYGLKEKTGNNIGLFVHERFDISSTCKFICLSQEVTRGNAWTQRGKENSPQSFLARLATSSGLEIFEFDTIQEFWKWATPFILES